MRTMGEKNMHTHNQPGLFTFTIGSHAKNDGGERVRENSVELEYWRSEI